MPVVLVYSESQLPLAAVRGRERQLKQAAARLGIRVLAPHTVELTDGSLLEVEAFLPDFGGPRGAVVIALDDDERCKRTLRVNQFVSQLASCYRQFDDDLFRETLDDFQWFGADGDRPDWYTGKPWT